MAPPPDVEVVLVLSETVMVSSVEELGEVLFVGSPRPLVAVSSSLVVTSSMGLLRSFRSLRSPSSRAGWGGGGGISVGVGLQGKPEVGGYG